jgi:hypothetical protein
MTSKTISLIELEIFNVHFFHILTLMFLSISPFPIPKSLQPHTHQNKITLNFIPKVLLLNDAHSYYRKFHKSHPTQVNGEKQNTSLVVDVFSQINNPLFTL